jgi:predicted nuclease of restriction endonuclease-like (RecB) superfamily
MEMAEGEGSMPHEQLVHELRELIDTVRSRVAQAVNSELVWLYWRIGARLNLEVLGGERAAYGEELVSAVSGSLTADYGRGFGKRNLYHMIRFAEAFPDPEIVHAVRTQVGWTHWRELIAIQDPLARQFYTELCRIERWSTRTLKSKVQGLLFERTAIARRPPEVVEQALESLRDDQQMTPDLVFRDPYVLDFLGLPTDFSEGELEAAILRELEAFLLELGQGFSFIARQKRMSIGPDDYYLDLLFFHRPLRALVAIELKLGRFDARDKGQMELYLRWLDRNERQLGENAPLGLILCADRNEEQVELLELTDGSVRVATYLTELPPREVLERKLVESIEHARARVRKSLGLPGGSA